MREIKFRGIALWSCKWVYGYVVFDGFGAYIVPIDKPFRKEPEIPQPMNWIEVDIETVGEFTGLSDKSGKEIYEGDIVKTVDGLMIVYFDDGCFWVESDAHGAPLYVYSDEDDHFSEVVGNIHEKPELL